MGRDEGLDVKAFSQPRRGRLRDGVGGIRLCS